MRGDYGGCVAHQQRVSAESCEAGAAVRRAMARRVMVRRAVVGAWRTSRG